MWSGLEDHKWKSGNIDLRLPASLQASHSVYISILRKSASWQQKESHTHTTCIEPVWAAVLTASAVVGCVPPSSCGGKLIPGQWCWELAHHKRIGSGDLCPSFWTSTVITILKSFLKKYLFTCVWVFCLHIRVHSVYMASDLQTLAEMGPSFCKWSSDTDTTPNKKNSNQIK